MKVSLVVFGLMVVMSGSARAQTNEIDHEFADVALGSWTYPALEQLIATSAVDREAPQYIGRLKSRYEFAVAVLRGRDNLPHIQDMEQRAKAEDIVMALNCEFAPETAKVLERVAKLDRPLDRPRAPVLTPGSVPFLRRKSEK